ncbi:MAG: CRTAC1 family protein [Gemmatimonadetes bacterium]|nr:CRTAC1 family protein [Gemmatimonadota bacterium]
MRRFAALATLVIAAGTPPVFTPVQPELFAAGGTLTNAWADFDGDGSPDLFVGFNGAPNRLYRNVKGTFTDVAVQAGVADARPTRAAAWGDFDNDGDPDLLVGFTPGKGSVLRLYRNTNGHFDDVTADVGLVVDSGAVRQFAFVDVDGDGDLDLFVAMRDRSNLFFRNDGGHFTEVAQAMGLADTRKSVGAVWFDADEDGDLDLVVANQDGDANALFRNDGGHFTDMAEAAGVAWGGRAPRDPQSGTVRPCAADINGDGHLDLFFANYGPNGLFLRTGPARYADASAAWGVNIDGKYDACAFGDMNHDGKVDLYVNGTVTGGVQYRDYLFSNTGTRYEDVTPDNIKALEADHGAEWVDFDRDGALDLSLTGATPKGMHLVLRNGMAKADAARSVSVRVLDEHGHATRAGAEVRVYATGTKTLLGMGLVDGGSGYNAQNDLPVHVGLPSTARVDIEVTVPLGGRRAVTTVKRISPAALAGQSLDVRTSVR